MPDRDDTQVASAEPIRAALPAFDPADHYWRVGDDASRVWSSRSGGYVPVSDPGYVAWLGRGMDVTTPIADEAALAAVLRDFGLPVPPAQVDLRGYAAAARYIKETAGITVGTATIATDRDSQALITGMWAAAQINPQISVSFKSGSGFVTIGAAQIGKIASAVTSHVQACFTAESRVDAAVTAGTVKTTADVDAGLASAYAVALSASSGASSTAPAS